MIPELGHFALILSLGIAIILGSIPLIGSSINNETWMRIARPAANVQFLTLLIAFLCLTYAFVNNDFSVRYVAMHSNSALPIEYRISAVWGGHEGSMLLWIVILAGWTFSVSHLSKHLPLPFVARVLGVMGLISIGLLLFLTLTSNPFERLFPVPMDGNDLNPLLQDPGLIIHPPMLYMGYVGFSVAFSFAIAALLGGHMDAAWARWSRPWTTVAWLFLTLGIVLGSWWAYYELGWGGWWFWDPVENASFMPWLAGTALIHSLAVTDQRSAFKSWTVLLAILAFSLSLLGTFLVRSGVLTSVHAFANDPERGIFILALLAIVIGLSLTLYAWRAPQIKSTGQFALISRESGLLINNILLLFALLIVLIGTLYPLIHVALELGSLSVGKPYFDTMFPAAMIPMLLLMGIGPALRWKKDNLTRIMSSSVILALVSIISGFGITAALFDEFSIAAALGCSTGIWVLITSLRQLTQKLKASKTGLGRAFKGMVIAHIGVGIFVIGVSYTMSFSVERDVRMEPGDTATLAGYDFVLEDISKHEGPNYFSQRGTVSVYKDGEKISSLFPEKRIYKVQRMPMTEAGIDAGLFRDLFIALGEPVSQTAWAVRVYHKPFIRWIWLGAIFMAIGGAMAISDRRYRLEKRRVGNLKTAEGTA